MYVPQRGNNNSYEFKIDIFRNYYTALSYSTAKGYARGEYIEF